MSYSITEALYSTPVIKIKAISKVIRLVPFIRYDEKKGSSKIDNYLLMINETPVCKIMADKKSQNLKLRIENE